MSALRRLAPVRSDSISDDSSVSIASTRASIVVACSETFATYSRERSTASWSVCAASRSASFRIRAACCSASRSMAAALASAASTIDRTCSDAAWASEDPLRRWAWRWSDSSSSATRARCSSTASGS
jgi:hypothetical protein